MIRILHSADLHLDSPFAGREAAEAAALRQAQLALPAQLAAICQEEQCDLVLLSGDVFDGEATRESCRVLSAALKQMAVPVFISPGNHDPIAVNSPWRTYLWPENVHIFDGMRLEKVELPELDCMVYGAGYQGMDCPGLLEGFQAGQTRRYRIGVLHADPTQPTTPYCPMTREQIRHTGLTYLALGHIHSTGSFWAGETLCAWPGCPMGRGYDETGKKGVLIAELNEQPSTRFVELRTPRFFDWEIDGSDDPVAAIAAVLPPAGGADYYRVTLNGYGSQSELDASRLRETYPHLEIKNRMLPEMQLWGPENDDTLEGVYFQMLRHAMDSGDDALRETALLAAKISRQILDGQEVRLP